MNQFGQSKDAYDRFSAAVELPLTILAVAWLPVLVVPLVARVPVVVADALDTVDYLVWAAFVAEYVIKLYLTPEADMTELHRRLDRIEAALTSALAALPRDPSGE